MKRRLSMQLQTTGRLLAGLVIVAVGGLLLAGCHHKAAAAAPNNPLQNQVLLHLDTITVNLADQDTDAYLRIGVDVGLNKSAPAAATASGDPAVIGLVRDTLLSVLTTRTSRQLLTPGGKDDLKRSLVQALNHNDPALGVKEIYFTDFLVQR